MPINPERILSHRLPEILHSYVERDAILYALGIGLGADPLYEEDLTYLLETRLKVLPTMAVILATPGMWMREPALGIDYVRLVHSAQSAVFFRPLPPRADVVASARIASLHDRGAGRGAILVVERIIVDATSGDTYCILRQTLLLRGDGGYGGPPPPSDEAISIPGRTADRRLSIATSRRAALIYRLSGDWNPLHADPAAALAAGFQRPILHGLASYGIAGLAVCRALGVPADHLRSLSVRFTGIVTPGDRLDFSNWREGDDAYFEARVEDRVVLGRGHAILREPT